MVQDLLGPVRRPPDHPWDPMLCGLRKWGLLRDLVLPAMVGQQELAANRKQVSWKSSAAAADDRGRGLGFAKGCLSNPFW